MANDDDRQKRADELYARLKQLSSGTGSKPPDPPPPKEGPRLVHSRPPQPKSAALAGALDYANRNCPVFPTHWVRADGTCSCGDPECKKSKGKHPYRVFSWPKDASKDPVQVQRWFAQYPYINFGVPTGKGSFTVLDVDGEVGKETLRTMELENCELPETPRAITGRDGLHILFDHEPGIANSTRFAPGLDIKNDGGYVVGVGSKTVGPYVWEVGYELGTIPLAKMPEWLVEKIKAAGTNGHGYQMPKLDTMVEGSGRNDALYRLGRSMKAKGLPEEAVRDAMEATNRRLQQPLGDRELRLLTANVMQQPDRREFVPAVVNGNGGVPALADDPYKDRRPVDAFEAWQIMSTEPRVYPIAGLLRKGASLGMSGLMGAGKTTLMLNMVKGLAEGSEVLGRKCMESKVLVVASPKEYDNWCETIGFWGIAGKVFIIESPKTHFGDATEQAAWFEAMMDEYGCQAFALDTLFDFYGSPTNQSGDQNRIIMNEQAPLLQRVRERGFYGIVGGHQPKSEAQAETPRDAEEAFGGHSGWMAQHRMRLTLRRKSRQNIGTTIIAILTGKGGYGDDGILEEQLLSYDAERRTVKLDGPFSQYLGKAAMPEMIDAIRGLGDKENPWVTMTKLKDDTKKAEKWIRAGLKEGIAQGIIQTNGKKRKGKLWTLAEFLSQEGLFELPNDDEPKKREPD